LVRGFRAAWKRLPRPWRIAIDWIVTIAVAFTAVLAFQAEVAKPYRIPSASMEPTLHCARPARGCLARFSDRVVAFRLAYRFRDPHRGEIVVFRAPPAAVRCDNGHRGIFVKRIAALPGEEIWERRGEVFVDGKRLDERYVPPDRRDTITRSWGRVPPGHYFMLGDNRVDSCDSRVWGAVARRDLIGPVVLTYWPPNRVSIH
jgi:signal peptidase I